MWCGLCFEKIVLYFTDFHPLIKYLNSNVIKKIVFYDCLF